ncbi:hypothetical protein [Companilactobacillus sp. HBUAS59699]
MNKAERLNQEELNYMVDYLISLGTNVKINYPNSLKQAYLKKLRTIINNY